MTGEPEQTAAEHERAIEAFSEELAQAYEQINLLYELGRSMNWLTRPQEFLENACSLLLDILDFAWVAVKVDAATSDDTSILVVAGALPCARSELQRKVAGLAGPLHEAGGPELLDPADSELAASFGSQLVVDRLMAGDKPIGLLLAGNKDGDDPDVTSVETQLLDATGDFLASFLHNVALYQEQREMFLGTIQALTAAIDAKDRYTRGHSERVAMLASRLAAAMGMTDEQVERVRIAGIVHDVGKIGVPEAVLRKPGRLTEEEFGQIKQHPRIGHTILKDIGPLGDVLPGVLHHHERWDGRGYPDGLASEHIPLLGRVLAVADTFDAMSSDRAYRPAIAREKVLAEILSCAGSQFDPELARLFVTLDLSVYDDMVADHRAAA